MKKSILFICCAIALFSCNSNDESFAERNIDDVVDINSILDDEKIYSFENAYALNEKSSLNSGTESEYIVNYDDIENKVNTYSSNGIEYLTFYGVTSFLSTGNVTAVFNTANAAVFGVAAGTYICEFYTLIYEFTLPDGYYLVTGIPNSCNALYPENSTEFGYAASISGRTVTLRSKTSWLKYDMNGLFLDRVFPIRSMWDVWWKVGIIQG